MAPDSAAGAGPDYKSDIVKILALGIFGMIGLLGLWGIDALLALCERHKWWTASVVVAAFGLGWAAAFLWMLVKIAWKTTRTRKSADDPLRRSLDAITGPPVDEETGAPLTAVGEAPDGT